MSLQDKVAIVTGAASGIGKEIAREFVANGAKVAIADLNAEAANATAAELDPSGARTLGVAIGNFANEMTGPGTFVRRQGPLPNPYLIETPQEIRAPLA